MMMTLPASTVGAICIERLAETAKFMNQVLDSDKLAWGIRLEQARLWKAACEKQAEHANAVILELESKM